MSEWCLVIFSVAIVVVCISSICLMFHVLKNKTTYIRDANKWYEQKFKELVSVFCVGLTLFSIIVSFLALLPRYDFEQVNQKHKELEISYQKILDKQKQIQIEQANLKQQIITVYNKEFAPKIGDQLNSLKSQLEVNEKQIIFLISELNKLKLTGASPSVEIPTVKTPTVEIPTVKTPTVEVPTVKTPTVEIPTVKTPKEP